jgi:hypothetical protein
MSLKELQDIVKPLTLPDILALEAKGVQERIDRIKILYERVFQQRVLPLLIRLISDIGPSSFFGCDINCAYSFDNTRVPNAKENPKYTRELFQDFVEYIRERLKTVFPDYDVTTNLTREPSICWGPSVYKLEAVLRRKDPLPDLVRPEPF